MSVTAIPGVTGDPPKLWGTALGLSLIAVGTGGIKPCVSAFGGDQFGKHQQHLVQGMHRTEQQKGGERNEWWRGSFWNCLFPTPLFFLPVRSEY